MQFKDSVSSTYKFGEVVEYVIQGFPAENKIGCLFYDATFNNVTCRPSLYSQGQLESQFVSECK
jgi:hypothetical protein